MGIKNDQFALPKLVTALETYESTLRHCPNSFQWMCESNERYGNCGVEVSDKPDEHVQV